MSKAISLKTSVYQLVKDYPEIREIMASLGFTDILLPGMLETAGRIMTLEKGGALKKIPLEKIRESLAAAGFQVQD